MVSSPPPKSALLDKAQAVLQRLHANPWFEWATITIILLSSLTIGLKSFPLPPPTESALYLLDWMVTIYFLLEIIIRIFSAGGIRAFFRGGGWNIFDFLIVTCSLIPVNESEYALLARLLRLFRVMRLIVFIPQLRVLIGALIEAVPRIGYVALMMFIIFYIYGAAGNLMFASINEMLWGNIALAMLTLFRVVTFEDWTDVMYETMEVYPFSWLFYLSFIFFSAFVFLNMMIAVIINVLNDAHTNAAETSAAQQRHDIQTQLQQINERLRAIEKQLERRT